MPYGLTQPSISKQLRELEMEAGMALFRRRPFELTPSGKLLYAFVEPFFERLRRYPEHLQAQASMLLRLGRAAGGAAGLSAPDFASVWPGHFPIFVSV